MEELAFSLQSLDDLLRQRMLDRLALQDRAEKIRQFNVGAEERARSHDLTAKMREDALRAAAQAREDARTQNFVQGMTPPSADVGEQMAGKIRELGLGGVLRTGPAQVQGGQTTGLESFPPKPTAPPSFIRGAEALPQGGFGYQAARQRAQEMAQQAAERQQEITGRAHEKLAETQRHNQVMEGFKTIAGSQEAAPPLSGPALDMTAKMYAKTGQLPPLGMGKAGASLRAKILDRASQYDPASDTFAGTAPPDIAGAKSTYSASQASEKQLTQNINAVTAFARTADKNAGLLREAIAAVPNTGLPFMNRPLRELARMTGDPAMARLDAIRQSVANEYSRLISQPNLTGVLSDTARREAEAILRGDATPQQMLRALETLKNEGENRRQSYQDQLEAVRGGIRGESPKPKKSAADWLKENGL